MEINKEQHQKLSNLSNKHYLMGLMMKFWFRYTKVLPNLSANKHLMTILIVVIVSNIARNQTRTTTRSG